MRPRRWPASFYRQQALVAGCIRAVPPRDMPLDVWEALSHANTIVRLNPREFSEFACAVAWVRYRQTAQHQQVHP